MDFLKKPIHHLWVNFKYYLFRVVSWLSARIPRGPAANIPAKRESESTSRLSRGGSPWLN